MSGIRDRPFAMGNAYVWPSRFGWRYSGARSDDYCVMEMLNASGRSNAGTHTGEHSGARGKRSDKTGSCDKARKAGAGVIHALSQWIAVIVFPGRQRAVAKELERLRQAVKDDRKATEELKNARPVERRFIDIPVAIDRRRAKSLAR